MLFLSSSCFLLEKSSNLTQKYKIILTLCINNEKNITFKQKYLEMQEISFIFVIRFLDFVSFSEIVIRGWLHPAPTSFFVEKVCHVKNVFYLCIYLYYKNNTINHKMRNWMCETAGADMILLCL